ncbi:hypothetical protein [Staphylococcus sp. LKG3-3]|uniref:hypothetical protein n=1 Tax=Staphylococcus sp. LKG3-3 TaxID=3399685 RepID=UPI003D4D5B48
MAKRGFLTETNIVLTLGKEDERIWYRHLTKEQRNDLIDLYLNDEEGFRNEYAALKEHVLSELDESELTKINALREKGKAKQDKMAKKEERKKEAQQSYKEYENTKVNNFLNKRGWESPSQASVSLLSGADITARFNTLMNSIGMMTTLKQEAQMQFNYYITSQEFAFVHAGQNDEIIKQNNKVIEQNENIIRLLKQIANKL